MKPCSMKKARHKGHTVTLSSTGKVQDRQTPGDRKWAAGDRRGTAEWLLMGRVSSG